MWKRMEIGDWTHWRFPVQVLGRSCFLVCAFYPFIGVLVSVTLGNHRRMSRISLLTSPRSSRPTKAMDDSAKRLASKPRLPLAGKLNRPPPKTAKKPTKITAAKPAAKRGRPRKAKAPTPVRGNLATVLQTRSLRLTPSRRSDLAALEASHASSTVSPAPPTYSRESVKRMARGKTPVPRKPTARRVLPTPKIGRPKKVVSPSKVTPKTYPKSALRKSVPSRKAFFQKPMYVPVSGGSSVQYVPQIQKAQSKKAPQKKQIPLPKKPVHQKKTAAQPRKGQKVQEVIHCFCGTYAKMELFSMICCDTCREWHHAICVNKYKTSFDDPYVCNRCRPSNSFLQVHTKEGIMNFLYRNNFDEVI